MTQDRATDSALYVIPDWPAPANIGALSTTRAGGVSPAPYSSLNLGLNTADDPELVQANRERLRRDMGLAREPVWLTQVHGNKVLRAEDIVADGQIAPEADASVASHAGYACAILTADCVPVLLCDRAGKHIAAVHAGWRGLACGVIEAACEHLPVPNTDLIAWLGPAISEQAYEVGEELRTRFVGLDPGNEAYFHRSADSQPGKFLADLWGIARRQLAALGIESINGGDRCTFGETESFYSYRRDGAGAGRMATLIWRRD